MFRSSVLAAALIAVTTSPARAQTPLPPCGVVSTSTKLSADCAGPLVVGASEISIDLKGHSVVCPNDESGEVGIDLTNRTAVSIKNGSVSCGYALVVQGGGSHKFSDLFLGLNSIENSRAIQMTNTTECTFSRVIADGGGDGRSLLLTKSHSNVFDRVTFRSSEFTTVSVEGDNNRITKSSIIAGLGRAALLVNGRENLIEGNQILGSTDSGILLSGDGDVLRNNTITSGYIGIEVEGSSHVVEKNLASNMEYGLMVSGSGHRLQSNTCMSNIVTDITYVGSRCAENRWKTNLFTSDSEGDGPKRGCIR